jgi:hypothetical protein
MADVKTCRAAFGDFVSPAIPTARRRQSGHPGPMAMGPNTIEGDCRNK